MSVAVRCNVNRSSPHFFTFFGAPFGRLFFSCHQTFLSTDNNNSHHPLSLCPSINNPTLDSIIQLPASLSSSTPTLTLPSPATLITFGTNGLHQRPKVCLVCKRLARPFLTFRPFIPALILTQLTVFLLSSSLFDLPRP